MRCTHVTLFGLLLLVIIGVLVLIWYFEGPDEGGYDQIKEPVIDRGISTFFGAYLPLLLLPFLLFFVLLICYLRVRAARVTGKETVDLMAGMPRSTVARESSASPPTLAPPVVVVVTDPAPSSRDEASLPPPHPQRPIPPLPEFEQAPLSSRSGLPSYDNVVYQQLCGSPVPPGTKKSSPQQQQQAMQPQQQAMQHSFHEGSLSATPVFDRGGMKPAHSATSISRGRVARNVNQSSKESAL